jgi:hypothetical protein
MRAIIICLIVALLFSVSFAQTKIHAVVRSGESQPVAATFELSDNSRSTNSPARVTAALGDSSVISFQPTLTISDSTGCSFSIQLTESKDLLSLKECLVDHSSGLWFQPNNAERQLLYLRPDKTLEWEIIIDSPIAKNQLSFPVELKNINAYFQPELNPTELLEGHERSDSVVGSYAIYRKSGGKLLHIFRPRIFDADGNSRWCDLSIDSLFTITIPDDFLAKATYPIRIDPTFGYSSAGASSLAAASIRCYGNRNASYRHTASAGERIDSFLVHLRTLTGNNDTLDIALYSWSSGLQNRLDTAVWTITASSTASWISTGPIAQSLTSGTNYTIAINHHEGTPRVSYDVGYSGDHSTDNVDNLPATWTEDATGTYLISMQACYSIFTQSGTTPTRRRRTL